MCLSWWFFSVQLYWIFIYSYLTHALYFSLTTILNLSSSPMCHHFLIEWCTPSFKRVICYQYLWYWNESKQFIQWLWNACVWLCFSLDLGQLLIWLVGNLCFVSVSFVQQFVSRERVMQPVCVKCSSRFHFSLSFLAIWSNEEDWEITPGFTLILLLYSVTQLIISAVVCNVNQCNCSTLCHFSTECVITMNFLCSIR